RYIVLVELSLSYATEAAWVKNGLAKVNENPLIDTTTGAGYGAFALPPTTPDTAAPEAPADATGQERIDAARDAEADDLKHRLIISAVLAVPIMLLSMIPALQFTNWQWAVLTMTTPVFFWGEIGRSHV